VLKDEEGGAGDQLKGGDLRSRRPIVYLVNGLKMRQHSAYLTPFVAVSIAIVLHYGGPVITCRADSYWNSYQLIMLLLAIGDFHIPDRASSIPAKFTKLLAPGDKIQQVLCLGNVCESPSTLEFLKGISPDFQMVKGEFDRDLSLPTSLVFNYDKLKIGLINGFNVIPNADPLSLLTQARLMNVDVLVSGGTHKIEAYTLDGKFFINPGSATGAFTTKAPSKADLEALNVDKNLAEDKEEDNDGKEDKDNKEREHQKQANEKTSEKPSPQTFKGETSNQVTPDEDDLDNINTDSLEQLDPIPSFCLLDIQGNVCTLYLYTCIDGDVKVDKVSYRKED